MDRTGSVSGRDPHHVHQACARPVGRRVEARPGRLFAHLAIGGDRAVDEPRVDREQVAGGDLQTLAHRQGEVGDEDVGRAQQAIKHREALGNLEIDGQAPLVAGRQLPPVVHGLAGTGDDARHGSPAPGGSILITSAPKSERMVAAAGPAIQLAQSITRRPENIPSLIVSNPFKRAILPIP